MRWAAAAGTMTVLALQVAGPALAAPEHLPRLHAHNDYEHRRPLLDALDLGFSSVEADVWWSGGRIRVSHAGWFSRGTLEELYLEPLRARVERLGSVHGDGRPFLLWIDLKDRAPELLAALRAALARYPMLSGCRPGGPVTVVLTGLAEVKRALTSGEAPVPACRDEGRFSAADPASDGRWTWYAIRWRDHSRWDGRSPMAPEERGRLRALVRDAHAKGRRVRLYHAPETELFWTEALAAGVDLVGTDDLGALRTLADALPGSTDPVAALAAAAGEE